MAEYSVMDLRYRDPLSRTEAARGVKRGLVDNLSFLDAPVDAVRRNPLVAGLTAVLGAKRPQTPTEAITQQFDLGGQGPAYEAGRAGANAAAAIVPMLAGAAGRAPARKSGAKQKGYISVFEVKDSPADAAMVLQDPRRAWEEAGLIADPFNPTRFFRDSALPQNKLDAVDSYIRGQKIAPRAILGDFFDPSDFKEAKLNARQLAHLLQTKLSKIDPADTSGTRGMFIPSSPQMEIALSPNAPLGTLDHELTHAMTPLKGGYKGTNPYVAKFSQDLVHKAAAGKLRRLKNDPAAFGPQDMLEQRLLTDAQLWHPLTGNTPHEAYESVLGERLARIAGDSSARRTAGEAAMSFGKMQDELAPSTSLLHFEIPTPFDQMLKVDEMIAPARLNKNVVRGHTEGQMPLEALEALVQGLRDREKYTSKP